MPFLRDDDADHGLRPGAPSTAQRTLSLPPSSPPTPFTGLCPLVLYRHLSDCPPAPRKFEKASEELGTGEDVLHHLGLECFLFDATPTAPLHPLMRFRSSGSPVRHPHHDDRERPNGPTPKPKAPPQTTLPNGVRSARRLPRATADTQRRLHPVPPASSTSGPGPQSLPSAGVTLGGAYQYRRRVSMAPLLRGASQALRPNYIPSSHSTSTPGPTPLHAAYA
ncbi:hypothetical protein DFH09DRAFT_1354641 [Mycena vulgaris]|nr:hypothetical protein DFH09DRAFT_1354641 [Mycena vulgaris]